MVEPIIAIAAAIATPSPDLPAQARQPALPDSVRAVLDQAFASGDAAAADAVVRFAIAAHPAAEAEIRALHRQFLAQVTERQQRQAAERRERLAEASLLEQWDGSVEVGASRSTGATDSLGFFGAVGLQRTGVDWSHRLSGRAEIQETDGRRTAERFSAEWQPRLKLGERLYGFGIARLERDPFVGIDARYSAGLGAGYSLIAQEGLRLELEGGAAYRGTELREAGDRSSMSGRASVDLAWRLSDALELKQTGALYFDRDAGSGTAMTALDAALVGPLRLRLSYELRFEKDLLRQLDSTSTGSRATLVYSF